MPNKFPEGAIGTVEELKKIICVTDKDATVIIYRVGRQFSKIQGTSNSWYFDKHNLRNEKMGQRSQATLRRSLQTYFESFTDFGGNDYPVLIFSNYWFALAYWNSPLRKDIVGNGP